MRTTDGRVTAIDRRAFLHNIGAAGAMGGAGALSIAASVTPVSAGAQGHIVHEVAEGAADDAVKPKHSIRFSVGGMSHDHIYGMVGAILRGGGVLASAYGAEPFRPQFVSDVIHLTHTAQDQEQALFAAELVIKAQRDAKFMHLS